LLRSEVPSPQAPSPQVLRFELLRDELLRGPDVCRSGSDVLCCSGLLQFLLRPQASLPQAPPLPLVVLRKQLLRGPGSDVLCCSDLLRFWLRSQAPLPQAPPQMRWLLRCELRPVVRLWRLRNSAV
jgi:hypothetical protein